MGVGAQLLIGGLDSLAYTPSVNPNFYGMKNQDPNDPNSPLYAADKDGNAVSLYTPANGFQRFISPTARQFTAQNAEFAAMPNQATAANQIQKNIIGQKYSAIPDYAKPPGADGQPLGFDSAYGMGYNGTQLPDQLKEQNTTAGELASGIVPTQITTGLNTAQTGLNNSTYDVGASKFALNQQSQEERIDAAKQDLAERQVKEIDPIVFNYDKSKAVVDSTVAKVHEGNAGIIGATANNQDIGQNVASRRLGPFSPYGNLIGNDGSVSLGKDPLGMSQRQIDYKVGMDMSNGGAETHTLPSGLTGHVAPKPYTEQPSTINKNNIPNSSAKSNYYLNHASDFEPTKFNPDILVDPNTQRAVYRPTGEDITDSVNSDPALVHNIAQDLKDKNDSKNADAEKVLKAKHVIEMQNLKDNQDAIAQQKPYGGIVGVGRDVLTGVNNTLSGNAASYLGDVTSNLHPWNTYNTWMNNGYKKAKEALIGD